MFFKWQTAYSDISNGKIVVIVNLQKLYQMFKITYGIDTTYQKKLILHYINQIFPYFHLIIRNLSVSTGFIQDIHLNFIFLNKFGGI